MALLDDVKVACRVTSNTFDSELNMLIESAKECAKQKGGKFLILHSQVQAKEFYLKTGFVVFSGIDYEEDCPHIWMGMELE
jgi:predicted GNAT family N-acyltransferase